MKHCGTILLETERLLLRPFTIDDAGAMYNNWASDEEVTKYLMWPAHSDISVSQDVLKEWISNYERDDYYQWAIVVKDNGARPIGTIGVTSCDEKVEMAHIGYCIGKKWWHKGITTEALKCVMTMLFDTVGMKRVESRHDPNNPNSGLVMKKCGMKYEGTLKKADWNNQGICDTSYYALLADER